MRSPTFTGDPGSTSTSKCSSAIAAVVDGMSFRHGNPSSLPTVFRPESRTILFPWRLITVARRGGLFYHRHFDTAVENIGQNLGPEHSLGGTAGEDDLIEGKPRQRFDDLHVAVGDIGCTFLDSPDTLLFTR